MLTLSRLGSYYYYCYFFGGRGEEGASGARDGRVDSTQIYSSTSVKALTMRLGRQIAGLKMFPLRSAMGNDDIIITS